MKRESCPYSGTMNFPTSYRFNKQLIVPYGNVIGQVMVHTIVNRRIAFLSYTYKDDS